MLWTDGQVSTKSYEVNSMRNIKQEQRARCTTVRTYVPRVVKPLSGFRGSETLSASGSIDMEDDLCWLASNSSSASLPSSPFARGAT